MRDGVCSPRIACERVQLDRREERASAAMTQPQRSVRPITTIASLDGLRAVSITIVFLAHSGLKGIVPGFFGVTVFFFLSGYLITTLLRIEFERSGDIGLVDFYVRRMFRIWPLFYLVLIVATLLTWLGAYGPPLPLDLAELGYAGRR